MYRYIGQNTGIENSSQLIKAQILIVLHLYTVCSSNNNLSHDIQLWKNADMFVIKTPCQIKNIMLIKK